MITEITRSKNYQFSNSHCGSWLHSLTQKEKMFLTFLVELHSPNCYEVKQAIKKINSENFETSIEIIYSLRLEEGIRNYWNLPISYVVKLIAIFEQMIDTSCAKKRYTK